MLPPDLFEYVHLLSPVNQPSRSRSPAEIKVAASAESHRNEGRLLLRGGLSPAS